MPTSGILKSGDSFFCITPSKYQRLTPLPPPHKHNSIQSVISLHEVQNITITIALIYDCIKWRKKTLSVMKYVRKCPRNPPLTQRKFEFGIHSKLKHRKAHHSFLSGRFGDPYGRPGDCRRIWESWHV